MWYVSPGRNVAFKQAGWADRDAGSSINGDRGPQPAADHDPGCRPFLLTSKRIGVNQHTKDNLRVRAEIRQINDLARCPPGSAGNDGARQPAQVSVSGDRSPEPSIMRSGLVPLSACHSTPCWLRRSFLRRLLHGLQIGVKRTAATTCLDLPD